MTIPLLLLMSTLVAAGIHVIAWHLWLLTPILRNRRREPALPSSTAAVVLGFATAAVVVGLARTTFTYRTAPAADLKQATQWMAGCVVAWPLGLLGALNVAAHRIRRRGERSLRRPPSRR